MPEKIEQTELTEWLEKVHSDWTLNDTRDQISRTFTFKNYYQTMAFANSVAWIAHQQDHHPDMHISYKTCFIEYSTHSAGGLTELDFNCATAIDQLVSQ